METLLQQSRSAYRGSVKISLDNLSWRNSGGSLLDEKNVRRLLKIFEAEGCVRVGDQEHNVPVLISRTRLSAALSSSHLTAADLYSVDTRTLTLPSDTLLPVLHGKHRLTAAERHLNHIDGRWWVVDLYEDELSSEATNLLTEQYSNAFRFQDGDIFRYIRHYELQGDQLQVQKWKARLSNSKMKDVKQLYNIPELLDAFDDLLPYRGLWAAMELGRLHRILALHCPQESANYLKVVGTVWRAILLDRPELFNCLDPATVDHLETLCPYIASDDTERIRNLMDDGTLFPNIQDTQARASMLEALLDLQWPILSLFTYFEDTKVLELGIKPLRQLLETTTMYGRSSSLPECFDSVYQPPDGNSVFLQKGNQHFEQKRCERNVATRLSFSQLFLCALRDFEALTDIQPRLDERSTPRRTLLRNKVFAQQHLAVTAYNLGYRTHSIDELRRKDPDFDFTTEFLAAIRPVEDFDLPEMTREALARDICRKVQRASRIPQRHDRLEFTTDLINITKTRRCGRPHSQEQKIQRKHMYIDIIHRFFHPVRRLYPTMMAMRRYMFLAFFGEFDLNLFGVDFSNPSRISTSPMRDAQPRSDERARQELERPTLDAVPTAPPDQVASNFQHSPSVYSQDVTGTPTTTSIAAGLPGEFRRFSGNEIEFIAEFQSSTVAGVAFYLQHESMYTVFEEEHHADMQRFIANLANSGCYFLIVTEWNALENIQLNDIRGSISACRIIIVREQRRND